MSARREWLGLALGCAAVLIVCGAGIWLWLSASGGSPAAFDADCAAVGELARDWSSTVQADAADHKAGAALTGQRWSTLSDKARAAAETVVTPSLKRQLGDWADEFSARAARQSQPAAAAGTAAGGAAPQASHIPDVLRATCPNTWPSAA